MSEETDIIHYRIDRSRPAVRHERSSFNRSHGHKLTCNAGLIIPIFLDEVLPGDTFNLRLTALGRMTTPIYPIMDNVRFFTHFFFTPNRLVISSIARVVLGTIELFPIFPN
jgi:hypothetical protein